MTPFRKNWSGSWGRRGMQLRRRGDRGPLSTRRAGREGKEFLAPGGGGGMFSPTFRRG